MALPIPPSIYINIRYSSKQQGFNRGEAFNKQGFKAMKTWEGLGVIETIYEADHEEEEDDDEEEEDSFSNPLSSFNLSPQTSLSLNLSSTPCTFPSSSPDLVKSLVDHWSMVSGLEANVLIRVHGHCFFLHKEPMSFHSRYLRRRLTKSDDVSLSPPFYITVETFAEVVRFCYGRVPTLTPSNVAAVRAAAELLEMEETDGDAVRGSLVRITEDYFRQEIACDKVRAAVVLQSCLKLLPESGDPAAAVAARCVQILTAFAEEEENFDEWIVDLMNVPVKSFEMIMDSMSRWSVHDHDHLYRIADRYFAINNERVSDEEKLRICHVIDCAKLSHHLLLHLVQNSRLPLRFIFKAMLISRHRPAAFSPLSSSHGRGDSSITSLRDLLHHDTDALQATNLAVRIESLERDVAGLRRHLRWSEDKRAEMESGRAKSFRCMSRGHEPTFVASRSTPNAGKGKRGRGLGRKLMDGFKSMFRSEGAREFPPS